MPELTDEESQAAKDDLQSAIAHYYSIVEPDAYVSAYVLVTHKLSTVLEREGKSAVGMLEMTGQPFPITRGMLEIAIDAHKAAAEPVATGDLG